MLALALTLSVLAASTDASVVVARRIGFEAKKGTELAQQLVIALRAKSASSRLGTLLDVPAANERLAAAGFPDTSVCNGAAACVASLAKVGGFTRLVALQLVKLGSDVAVDASVIDGTSGKSLASVTRTIKVKNADEEFGKLAGDLLAKVPPLDMPTEPPLPPVARVEPATPTADPVVDVTPPTPGLSSGRKVSLGLGGAAVVAVGVGIGLGVSASAQANQLSVRDPSYEAKVAATKGTALGADLSYGAAGAIAVTAIIVWVVSGK